MNKAYPMAEQSPTPSTEGLTWATQTLGKAMNVILDTEVNLAASARRYLNTPGQRGIAPQPRFVSVARFLRPSGPADDANNALTPTRRCFAAFRHERLRRSTGVPGVAASEATGPPSWRLAAASIVHPSAFAQQLETERALAGPHLH